MASTAARARSRRRRLAPVRSTPVAGARVGSRKAAPGSATVDVHPAPPTGPRAAHRSAYVAPAAGLSVVLAFGRTRSRHRSMTEGHPAGGRLRSDLRSRPVGVATREDASRTPRARGTSSNHQGRRAWTHRPPARAPVVGLKRVSLPSSPRPAAWVLYVSPPSRCLPTKRLGDGVYTRVTARSSRLGLRGVFVNVGQVQAGIRNLPRTAVRKWST